MIGRANYASALVDGIRLGRPSPMDGIGLAKRHGCSVDRDAIIDFYAKLILGATPSGEWTARLMHSFGPGSDSDPEWSRKAVALILALPEAQLG